MTVIHGTSPLHGTSPGSRRSFRNSTPAFARNLEDFGTTIALIDAAGQEVSYAELARLADAAVSGWTDEQKLVLIEAANSLEAVAAYLGCLRAGHRVILTGATGDERLARLLDRFEPDVTFDAASGWSATVLEGSDRRTDLHDSLSLLLPTSGTTGEPKLVRLSRTNIDSNARQIADYLGIRSDRAITALPWHYSYGLSVIHSYLATGSTVVLTDLSVSDPEFFDVFDRHRCTSLAGVPFSFELLERTGFLTRPAPASLRYLTVAGGRMHPEKVRLFAEWAVKEGLDFFVMYGQTEAAPRIAYLPPELATRHPDAIGVPVPGGALSIRDEAGRELEAPGAIGELVYRGPNVMMGYATQRGDLARGTEVEELRTGDLASCDPSGLFRIVGRVSRFAKLFGLRISFDDIEDLLSEQGYEAKVTGDDELIAVMLKDAAPDARNLQAEMADKIGVPVRCFAIQTAQEFPRLPSGKIDYATILAAAHRQCSGPEQGCTLGQRLAEILGRGEIDRSASYVELGADSLTFVQASLLIEAEIGQLPADWEHRPVAELEELARQTQKEELARPKTLLRSLDPQVLLRALAITGVVVSHAAWTGMVGGAFLLYALAGTLLARFRYDRLVAGRIVEGAFPPLGRILMAFYLVLIGYEIGRGDVDIRWWLLVGNFSPTLQSEHTLLPYYWFIPNFVQTVLLYSLLFAIPAYRRLSRERPWGTALGTLVASFAVALVAQTIVASLGPDSQFSRGHFSTRTPMFIFYIFAFGWCMAFARTRAQRLLLSLLAVLMFPTIGETSTSIWLVSGSLLAIWLPPVPLPSAFRAMLAAIAAASLYIFIAHMIPVQALRSLPALQNPVGIAGTIVAATLLGIGLSWLTHRAELLIAQLARRMGRQPGGSRQGRW